MLSKLDIDKELGKEINIYPFNEENIKENSINLSSSQYAWAMKNTECYYNKKDGNLDCHKLNENYEKIEIIKGKSVIRKILGEDYIILAPLSTTLIETKEVIGIGKNIGGTVHSKVGIVSLGIGHNGTMFGPNFCGHSLIAVHNVSDYPLKIKVGETIVSIVFHYLKTGIDKPNATDNGHLDKMAALGIKLSVHETLQLNKDWKRDIDKIREKMCSSKDFKEYKKQLKRSEVKRWLDYINIVNIIIIFIAIGIFYAMQKYCNYLDLNENTNIYTERFWSVGCSGFVVFIIQIILGMIKKSNN